MRTDGNAELDWEGKAGDRLGRHEGDGRLDRAVQPPSDNAGDVLQMDTVIP